MTGVVAWLTGPPASGKSTLAAAIAAELRARGVLPVILDGDEVRAANLPARGYDDASRAAHYATLSRLAALIARQGHIVLVPATAHRRAFRDDARAEAPAFLEVFVDTPHDECRRRDPKGLYAAGVLPPYEPPLAPEVVVHPGDARAAAAIAARLRET